MLHMHPMVLNSNLHLTSRGGCAAADKAAGCRHTHLGVCITPSVSLLRHCSKTPTLPVTHCWQNPGVLQGGAASHMQATTCELLLLCVYLHVILNLLVFKIDLGALLANTLNGLQASCKPYAYAPRDCTTPRFHPAGGACSHDSSSQMVRNPGHSHPLPRCCRCIQISVCT
jgi:hypothetical protein